MKIYIAGKVRGLKNYKEVFKKAENKLRNIDLTGWTLEREIEKFNEEVNEFINVINNKDDDITFFHAV